MTLEMMYFRTELVQLIVVWSDAALEVQRYGMKKNTLTVDPIMLEDCERDSVKNRPQTSRFFENRTAETVFRFLNFGVPKRN